MQHHVDIEALNHQIHLESAFLEKLNAETGKLIVGQEAMLERLLIGLLTRGHILLEGMPGLAKTLAIKTLAQAVDAHFSRIQFTPDLLPSDVIGTQIYNPAKAEFTETMRRLRAITRGSLIHDCGRKAKRSSSTIS